MCNHDLLTPFNFRDAIETPGICESGFSYLFRDALPFDDCAPQAAFFVTGDGPYTERLRVHPGDGIVPGVGSTADSENSSFTIGLPGGTIPTVRIRVADAA
jgi:hypothetical protein